MAHQEPRNVDQYPLDWHCYRNLEEIGRGVNSIVYKAICLPMNSKVVAIKAIDLDRSRPDFEEIVRREFETMSRLSHPNILKAHCTFTVDRQLRVVMPFMSGGSLQSIMSSSFPDGLPEPCIAVVLKETLEALVYLHEHGHLHKGIKPELAHGRPPLSHLPPSKSLIIKIRDRFRIRFSDYEYEENHNRKNNFSDSFKDMVVLCLDQDSSERASARNLLKLSFFRNCINGSDFLVENVLQVGECGNMGEMKIREWAFNVDGFALDPILCDDDIDQGETSFSIEI
ncbi:hypothetical protein F0562_018159 [Nyssa sinensis]|uniref:Protein kinase domain-containing protein n=1 Tax=Nyssa sinensis TaxID=561372 RepID=A0A5J4ZBG2_9ASTE|nr:hypothetical protein F0562_018159 [Nyssa sinensis]